MLLLVLLTIFGKNHLISILLTRTSVFTPSTHHVTSAAQEVTWFQVSVVVTASYVFPCVYDLKMVNFIGVCTDTYVIYQSVLKNKPMNG